MIKLLIGTHNPGKLREYRALLGDLPLEITSLTNERISADLEETGATFEENARLKSEGYARLSGLLTWADDSGLEVDALGGRPGIFSARYAGPRCSDHDNTTKLLAELADVPLEQRTARFRCVAALTFPDGQVQIATGVLEGLIGFRVSGNQGFGYDPLFSPRPSDADEFIPRLSGATLGELPAEYKNRISHRAQASAAARKILETWLAQQ